MIFRWNYCLLNLNNLEAFALQGIITPATSSVEVLLCTNCEQNEAYVHGFLIETKFILKELRPTEHSHFSNSDFVSSTHFTDFNIYFEHLHEHR